MRVSNRSFMIALLLLLATSATHAQTKSGNWISGSWEGTGYQTDDKSTWEMQLMVRGKVFSVNYPSLNCGGRWRLISISATHARFREILDHGQDKCIDKGTVVIQRLSGKQISYLYSNPDSREVTASAILNRQVTKN